MQGFLYSHIMYHKVSAACYCGTFDQYEKKLDIFLFYCCINFNEKLLSKLVK